MTTSPAAGATTVDAEIGARIIKKAADKGISLQALCDVTPISYPTLLKSLTGERSFKVRELGTISDVLGVTTVALMQDGPAESIQAKAA